MDWVSFGKRFVLLTVICIIAAWVATIVIFQIWTFTNFFLILVGLGIFLLVFGACLQTPFIEAMATARYAVNPQVTRDTARHYPDRRSEQSGSGIVILASGALLLIVGLLGYFLLPLFPVI
ncbi:MAG: hypothetical protein ACFFBR_00485 [Promethearchaeota archaeon]